TPSHDHAFDLEGLEPGATYYYQVLADGPPVFPAAALRTLPEPGSPLTVAVFGDSGTVDAGQAGVRKLLLDLDAPLILHAGDLAYPRGNPQYYQDTFFVPFRDVFARSCVFPVLGNHDCLESPRLLDLRLHHAGQQPAPRRGLLLL